MFVDSIETAVRRMFVDFETVAVNQILKHNPEGWSNRIREGCIGHDRKGRRNIVGAAGAPITGRGGGTRSRRLDLR